MLLGSLWLSWYRVTLPEPPEPPPFGVVLLVAVDEGDTDTTLSAWNLFSVLDVLLAVLAAALVVLAARPVTPWLPRVLAVVAGALVLFRVVVPPYELLEPAVGGLLALTAALAVAAWPEATRRVSPAQLAAGFGGCALLLSLGLTWFDAAAPTGWTTYAPLEADGEPRLGTLDIAVALIAIPALLVPLRPPLSRIAIAVGWLALVLIIGRIVFPPDDASPAPGLIVALVAAAIAWAGALLAGREERHAPA